MARYRLVHVGTAALLSAGVMTTVGVAQSVLARPSLGTASSFVPIKPCRLMDTRVESAVGTRTTPIGAAETATVAVWGEQGNCFIPDSATGIAANVTAVNPTAASHLTVFPAEGARPRTSNLNWRAGGQPVANHIAVGLPPAQPIVNVDTNTARTDIVLVDGLPTVQGAIRLYNYTGTVDVVIDVTGYYEPALAGPQGPQGEPGKDGQPGVGDLGCTTGQTATWNDLEEVWVCSDPVRDTDSLAELECTTDQMIKWNGEAWACVDPVVDTLGALECTVNQSVRWNGEAWECRNEPIVATLSIVSVERFAFGQISDVFDAYSPNVDATGFCDDLFCEIQLVDVVDHTSCQVTFSGNSNADLSVDKSIDRIMIHPMFVLTPGEPFYVNVSCNT